jgi:hypothetical protein
VETAPLFDEVYDKFTATSKILIAIAIKQPAK